MIGRSRLILVCGLPGSGKTTLARQLARQLATELRAVRLCPDEWLADLELDVYDERARDLAMLADYENAFEAPTEQELELFDLGSGLRRNPVEFGPIRCLR